MKRNILFIYLSLSAQLFNLSIAQTIFTIDSSFVFDVEYDATGNSILCGANSNSTFICKTDTLNNIQWSKSINGKYINQVMTIEDDSYLVSQNIGNNNSHSLSKLNSLGNVVWSKSIILNTTNKSEFVNKHIEINGNKYLGVINFDSTKIYYHVISQNGIPLYSIEIPNQALYVMNFISGTVDSLGNSYISYISDGHLINLIKINSSGNLMFHKQFNHPVWFEFFLTKIQTLNNNKIVLLIGCGSSLNPFIYEFDSQGNPSLAFEIHNQGGYFSVREMRLQNNKLYFTGEIMNGDVINGEIFANVVSLIETDLNYSILNTVSTNFSYESITIAIKSNELQILTNAYGSKFGNDLIFDCDTVKLICYFEVSDMLDNYQTYTQINYTTNFLTSTETLSSVSLNIVPFCQLNSIEVDKIELEINIYPNPSSSFFILEFEGETKNLNYSIHDILGKEILSGKINSIQTKIDCENWSSGVYLIKIGDEDGYRVEKIVVEK